MIVLGFLGTTGYSIYDYYRAGFFDLPELATGSYIVSFKNGLRGIVVDAKVSDSRNASGPALLRILSRANPERRYLGIPFKVASWFENAWSTCVAPPDGSQEFYEKTMPEETKTDLIGARLDAVCYIDLDGGEKLGRGLIYSVPRL